MDKRDISALLKAIDQRGFKPETLKDKHTISMARQAVQFGRDLKWPDDANLKAIYRRVYGNT